MATGSLPRLRISALGTTYPPVHGFRAAWGVPSTVRHDGAVTASRSLPLDTAAAEIEAHVARAGWDAPPVLFALVRAAQLAADEPDTAARLGLEHATGNALTPIEQDDLPEGDLDSVLAQIAWPEAVVGCALSQEILLLPPQAEAGLSDESISSIATHPDRREARLVAAVLRDGSSTVMLRLRGSDQDDLLTGPDLAPNLIEALLATFD